MLVNLIYLGPPRTRHTAYVLIANSHRHPHCQHFSCTRTFRAFFTSLCNPVHKLFFFLLFQFELERTTSFELCTCTVKCSITVVCRSALQIAKRKNLSNTTYIPLLCAFATTPLHFYFFLTNGFGISTTQPPTYRQN